MKVTRQSLKKMGLASFENDRMYVSEHDGKLWATNSYYLVTFDRIRSVWEEYNLPTEEVGTYKFTGTTIMPDPSTPPNLGFILGDVSESDPQIWFRHFGRSRLMIELDGRLHYTITDVEGWTLRREYVDLVSGDAHDIVLRQAPGNLRPVSMWGDGQLLGLVMPHKVMP